MSEELGALSEETDLVLAYPRIYSSLEPVEGDLACNVETWMHLTNPVYDLEQVATRQAGYSVEPYICLDGQARAFPVTATTSLEVKGFSEVPLGSRQPLDTDMNVSSRWVATPEDYNGLQWAPAAGNRSFSMEGKAGEAPALLFDTYSYTLGRRRVSATVLDFDGSEMLSMPVTGWSGLTVVMAAVLRRGSYRWYGVMALADTADADSSRYPSLRYTDTDELELWHDEHRLLTARRSTAETELVIVGMCVDEADDTVGYMAVTPGRTARRVMRTPSDAPNIPSDGVLVLGRAAGTPSTGAVMQVIDVSVRVDDGSFAGLDDLVGRYVTHYFATDDDDQEER